MWEITRISRWPGPHRWEWVCASTDACDKPATNRGFGIRMEKP